MIVGVLMSIVKKGVVSIPNGDIDPNSNKWSIENMNFKKTQQKIDIMWVYSYHHLTPEHFQYLRDLTQLEHEEEKKIKM